MGEPDEDEEDDLLPPEVLAAVVMQSRSALFKRLPIIRVRLPSRGGERDTRPYYKYCVWLLQSLHVRLQRVISEKHSAQQESSHGAQHHRRHDNGSPWLCHTLLSALYWALELSRVDVQLMCIYLKGP